MKGKIVMLAFLVLSVGMIAFAMSSITATEKNAKVIGNTIYGDVSKAEGISVSFSAHAGQSLGWTSTYDFATQTGETEFHAYDKSKSTITSPDSNVPKAEITTDMTWNIRVLNDMLEETPGRQVSQKEIHYPIQKDTLAEYGIKWAENVEETYSELTDGLSPGEYRSATIHIKDIVEYYPLGFYFSNGNSRYTHSLSWEDVAATQGEDREMFKDINEFFRIPVLDKEVQFYDHYTVDSEGKPTDGTLSGGGADETEETVENFPFEMMYCNTDDAFYMLFDAHAFTSNGMRTTGTIVDTSQIEGGFGIYKLPCDLGKSDFYTDQLETVYSLDPENYYSAIELSPDGKSLLVIANDEEKVWAEVISLADMKLVQKIDLISLVSLSAKDVRGLLVGLREISDDSDSSSGEYLICTNVSKLAVLSFADGEYHLDMAVATGEAQTEEVTRFNALCRYYTPVEYDGQRLVITGYIYPTDISHQKMCGQLPDGGDSCMVGVAVFEADGLAYYGTLTTNLVDYIDEESAEAFASQAQDADGDWTGFWEDNSDCVVTRDDFMLEVMI